MLLKSHKLCMWYLVLSLMLVQFLNMCQSFGDTYENENTYVRNGVEDMHIGYTRALFALWRIGIRH